MLRRWNSEPVLKALSTFLDADEKIVLQAETLEEAKKTILQTAKEKKSLSDCYEELEMLNEKNATDVLLFMQKKMLETKTSTC